MKKMLNIFDIDGTILPAVFSNFSPNERAFGNKDFVALKTKQLEKVSLFDYFQLWYAVFNQEHECINIFLTGRKVSEYSDITIKQLEPLEKIGYTALYFYPEALHHDIIDYNIWKFMQIKEIINIYYDKNTHVNVFDDNIEYFRFLNVYYQDINLITFLANSNEFWMSICQVKEGI